MQQASEQKSTFTAPDSNGERVASSSSTPSRSGHSDARKASADTNGAAKMAHSELFFGFIANLGIILFVLGVVAYAGSLKEGRVSRVIANFFVDPDGGFSLHQQRTIAVMITLLGAFNVFVSVIRAPKYVMWCVGLDAMVALHFIIETIFFHFPPVGLAFVFVVSMLPLLLSAIGIEIRVSRAKTKPA
jgi:cytochrome c oxidase subunit IV